MTNFSIETLLQQLVGVSNQAYYLILKIEDHTNLSRLEQDARYVALDGIQQTTMACVKWISADHQLRNRIHKEFGDNWQSQYLHLINGGDNLEPAEIQMMNLLRSSFALKLHFSIENLFVNLIKTKNPNYSDVGFYKIFTKILNYCGIPDHGIERKTACALANIRNSFHTNGIHTQPNMSIELKNKEFKFCEGEALMCASWEHLIIVASVNIELLETILLNPAFNLTKEIIPDKFSSLDL